MELQKVIKTYKINNEYKEFVEQFVSRVSTELGDSLHSIYICGSIPKGKAVLYKSDADFTIACNHLIDNLDKDKLNKIKSDLLNEYPFITKIDIPICTIDDVKDKALEWGFWLKIICYCIYGVDLGEEVPGLIANNELILNLSSDIEESINKFKSKLENTEDKDDLGSIIRDYSKCLIRGLYTLILEDVGEWKDDIKEMKNLLNTYMNKESLVVDKLYLFYTNNEKDKQEFESYAEVAINIIISRLRKLAISRNLSNNNALPHGLKE